MISSIVYCLKLYVNSNYSKYGKKQGSGSAVLQYNWDAALIIGKISGDYYTNVALLSTRIDCECGSFPFEKVLVLDGKVELILQMYLKGETTIEC